MDHPACHIASIPRAQTAVQYIRMSTDLQTYSPELQKNAIAEYATRHQFSVVATYEDFGKSGLTLKDRPALRKLLDDVRSPTRTFDVVLVYDVSRWGRFQDVDESAYYEFVCRQTGVQVLYCTESFENDGSPSSNIIKMLKRAMAGEYSRELSNKVAAGHRQLAERGFWQGGPPGYGLRRVLVDASRTPKGYLRDHEHKSIQSDRVVLVPGEPQKVALIRRMYEWYISEQIGPAKIAHRLNSFGIFNEQGQPWLRNAVARILSNEIYAGVNVFGRTECRLHGLRTYNPPLSWIRVVGAFEPVIDRTTFDLAQAERIRRTRFPTNVEIADGLTRLFQDNGTLNSKLINSDTKLPTTGTLRRRFGSLLEAYHTFGFDPPARSAQTVETLESGRQLLTTQINIVIDSLQRRGHLIERSDEGTIIRVNRELRIKFGTRSFQTLPHRVPLWDVWWPKFAAIDLFVVFRTCADNLSDPTIYVFPKGSLPNVRNGWELRHKGLSADVLNLFSFTSIDILHSLADRSPVENLNGYLNATSHSSSTYR